MTNLALNIEVEASPSGPKVAIVWFFSIHPYGFLPYLYWRSIFSDVSSSMKNDGAFIFGKVYFR